MKIYAEFYSFSYFFLIIIVFVSTFAVQESSTSKYLSIVRFLAKLQQINFPKGCIVFTWANTNESQQLNQEILNLLASESQSVSATNFMIPVLSKTNVKGERHVRRYGTTIKLTICIVSEYNPYLPSQFFKLFTPRNGEITRRDEDYYVFITFTEKVSNMLLKSSFSNQLRYKVFIHPTEKINSIVSENSDSSYIVRSICIYCPEKDIISFSTSQSIKLSQLFPDFTRHFHSYSIRISAPTKYVATYEMQIIGGIYRHKRGIHALIFNTVAEKLNMSYTLKPCSGFGNIPEGASGVWLENGTWAGCVGDVVDDRADIALSVSPSERRFPYVEFTSPMIYSMVSFTTSKPSLYYSWTSIFTALKPIAWTFIVVSIILSTSVIYFIDPWLEKLRCPISTKYSSISSPSSFEIGMYLFGYLVGQDVPAPKYIATKVTYTSWLFYGFVIGAIYGSSLQAMIVSPGLSFVPRTFLQLSVSKNYRMGASSAFRDGLGEQLFRNSKNPIMRLIYQRMEGDKNEVLCIEKTILSHYACFNWDLMQRFHFATTFADKSGQNPFQIGSDTTFFISLNFITRKREIFRSHFNHFMKWSFDTGLVQQTIAKDWRGYRKMVIKEILEGTRKKVASKSPDDGPKPFGLDIVKGSFYVLITGIFLSAIAFLVEAGTRVWKLLKTFRFNKL